MVEVEVVVDVLLAFVSITGSVVVAVFIGTLTTGSVELATISFDNIATSVEVATDVMAVAVSGDTVIDSIV